MRTNHHQFMAFAYVVREGSFSAAAARLGVTQSTVTQHIAKLEEQVGAQIVIRGRDGVTLTRTGEEFYDLADRLVTLQTTISEQLEGFAALNKGYLKVIANAPQPALKIIGAFGRRYPDVRIDFGLHDWTTATRMIRDRLADIGLITSAPPSEDWICTKVHETRYVAYVPKEHALAGRGALSLHELTEHTVILPELGSLTERVVSTKLRELGLTLPRVIRTTTFPVMCEAVMQGIGIAIFLQESSLLNDAMVELPVHELDQTYETSFVAPKDRARLRLIAAFAEVAEATSR